MALIAVDDSRFGALKARISWVGLRDGGQLVILHIHTG